MTGAATASIPWGGPPRFLAPPAPIPREDGTAHYGDVTYAVPFGYRPLQLDLWVPATAGRAPLVIWVHGGAWVFGDRRDLPPTLQPGQVFDALIEAGLAVASIDYRLVREAAFPPSCMTSRPRSATCVGTPNSWVWTRDASGSGVNRPAVTWRRWPV